LQDFTKLVAHLKTEIRVKKPFNRYFHSASLKGESRQVLHLMGPVGSGKSALIERSLGAL
jgi:predicted Ser/Thr protein kinase